MVRIQCQCGKNLKVGDGLVGKRIKCPACGASQLVERVAEAIVEAIPKAVIEENAAPAQKGRRSSSRWP